MHCLVTGVAGFIGSHVAEALLLQGNSVIGVDSFTDYYARPIKEHNLSRLRTFSNFRLVDADLRTADLAALIKGTSVVIHQAGQPGVRMSWGDQFVDYVSHNIAATQRLLEAADRAGGPTLRLCIQLVGVRERRRLSLRQRRPCRNRSARMA